MIDEAYTHWKEIGRLTGWRLGAYNGMNSASFYAPGDTEVYVTHHTGAVIKAMSDTLSEVADSFRALIENVEELTAMKPGLQRTLAAKETRLLARSFERNLDALQCEEGYLFSDTESVEEDS